MRAPPRSAVVARLMIVAVTGLASCARAPQPSAEPAPSAEHLIAPPPPVDVVEPAGLSHLLRGLHFLQRGHPDAAIPHLRLALIYDAGSAYLHQKLAEAWAASGRLDRARDVIRAGLERAPHDPWLAGMGGELARRQQHFEEAVALLSIGATEPQVVSSAGPGLVDVLLWLGRAVEADERAAALLAEHSENPDLALQIAAAFEDHGRLTQALAAYRAAREQRPASQPAAYGETRVLDLLERGVEAAERLAPLFAHYPEELGLYVQIARLYRRAGRSEADAYRSEALRLAGSDPELRSLVAAGELADGNVAQAVGLLADTAVGSSGGFAARLMLAEVHAQVGAGQSCLREVDAVGQLIRGAAPGLSGDGPASDPLLAAYARTRAACLALLGREEEALASLSEGLAAGASAREVASEAARVVSRRVDAAAAKRHFGAFLRAHQTALGPVQGQLAAAFLADHYGDYAESLAIITALHERDPVDVELRLRWADALLKNDRTSEGLAVMRSLVQEEPLDPSRLNALGYTLADLDRDLDEAEVLLRRAYRQSGEEAYIVDSLGWLFFRRGQLESAERLLRRASAASPNDAEILRHLGAVLAARGKKADAKTCFEQALAAHPPRELAKQIQEHLRAM